MLLQVKKITLNDDHDDRDHRDVKVNGDETVVVAMLMIMTMSQ